MSLQSPGEQPLTLNERANDIASNAMLAVFARLVIAIGGPIGAALLSVAIYWGSGTLNDIRGDIKEALQVTRQNSTDLAVLSQRTSDHEGRIANLERDVHELQTK